MDICTLFTAKKHADVTTPPPKGSRNLPVLFLSAVLIMAGGCGDDSGTNIVPEANVAGGTTDQGGGTTDLDGDTTDPGGDTTDPGGGTTDPSDIVPTWFGVQAKILEPFCTLCHSGSSPPAGLSWEVDQYDTIITQSLLSTENSTMLEVNPTSPDTSYMMWKLRGEGPAGEAIEGVRMPATGIPLDPALIDVISQWISDGAPLGVPEDADSGGPAGPVFPVGSWMYVWTEALQVCTLCHSNTPSSPRCGAGGDLSCPPKGIVLTNDNYNGVVNGVEVEPGDLGGSELWDRVTDPDPDKRMPFGLDPLTQAQLDIIQDWIIDGAPFCPSGEICP